MSTGNPGSDQAQVGDLAMLVAKDRKQFLLLLEAGQRFETHHGVLAHDDLIGRTWGATVESHLGAAFHLLQPSLRDLLLLIERRSQTLYPKDVGYVLLRLSAGPGKTILEAGTGSGALTLALAWAVGREGQVLSIDPREDMQKLALANLTQAGLEDRVALVPGRVEDAHELAPADALFLDLPQADKALQPALRYLRSGGSFGALVPTANQVSSLLTEMDRLGFANIDVCEILLRFYKTTADRFRPADRMVAHTGYLVFGMNLEGAE